MMHWGPGWGWGFVTDLGSLALWVLVIWLVVTAVRSNGWSGRGPTTGPDAAPAWPSRPGGAARPDDLDPERILAARFARGEIDEDEYRRRLDVLRTNSRGSR